MTDSTRSGVPLHLQIARILRARIESGCWPGDGAPATEHGLCEEFGASRTTVRQALRQLKSAGLLESRTGVGTRSLRPPAPKRLLRGIGDPLHAGLNTRPRVVAAGELPCPRRIAEFFGIEAGSPVWHFVRVNMIDGQPLSVVDSYLPAQLGAGLSRAELNRPMYELLWERFGIRLHRSVHTLRVGRAEVDIAPLLGVPLADPVLRIQSSVFLADGTPIRWTENHFHEDRYEYVAEMKWAPPDGPRKPKTVRGTARAQDKSKP